MTRKRKSQNEAQLRLPETEERSISYSGSSNFEWWNSFGKVSPEFSPSQEHGKETRNQGTVKAFTRQAEFSGTIHVTPIQVNINTDIWTRISNVRKRSKASHKKSPSMA